MTVAEAIRAGAERLARSSDTARLDAELLMAHALGCARSEMLLGRMRDPAPAGFDALLERRAGHEPLAYLTGVQEFWGLAFRVTSEVLIPRADSETLVRAALEAKPGARRVLDMGTGSGALLLACLSELPEARGTGIDASDRALAVAGSNAEALGLDGRARFERRDWREAGWADGLGTFDLVLCNPPYVEEGAELSPSVRDYEPSAALFSGPEGLDDYRRIVPQLRALMEPEGAAVLEIGHRQGDAVSRIARESGFSVELRRDLAERPRSLILT